MTYKKLNEINLSNKSVLLRLDLNTPIENGLVANNERIVRSLPTLNYIVDAGARLTVISHLGRPEENNTFQEEFSLKPVVKELEGLLNKEIMFYSLDQFEDLDQIPELSVIENTRFCIGEKTNDIDLSKRLAKLADLFVLDAFATSHRAHASTTGVITFSTDACAGLLLDEELNALSKAKEESKNSVAILGGAKISTKLSLINSLSKSMDKVILGGGIANTIIAAKGYDVGKSLVEESMLSEARELLENPKIIIPNFVMVSDSPDKPGRVTSIDSVAKNEAIFDIAPESLISLEPILMNAGTILWNGPLGFFEKENFDKGTMQIAEMIISSKGFSVVGGGDTISAAEKAGVLEKLNYVSTAGGAFLEFMEGRKLPAIEALKQKAH
jgi:phosphoglycerate kinase